MMIALSVVLAILSHCAAATPYDAVGVNGFMSPYMQPGPMPLALPQMQFQTQGTPHPISGNAPESLSNVLDYEIPQPTPPPAGFNGVYCRGSACQYRVPPPPMTMPPVTPFPNVPYPLNYREFCRGLSCFPMMGWPANPPLDEWKMNCAHLYDVTAGGMSGNPASRGVMDVRKSFTDWCLQRVDITELGKCKGPLADAVLMAISPTVTKPSVGGTPEVCEAMYMFDEAANKAFVDLKLLKEALPPPPGKGASLLSVSLNRFGTGGVGPDTPRGRKWKDRLYQHRSWLPKDFAAVIEAEMRGAGKREYVRTNNRGASFLSRDLSEDASTTGCRILANATAPKEEKDKKDKKDDEEAAKEKEKEEKKEKGEKGDKGEGDEPAPAPAPGPASAPAAAPAATTPLPPNPADAVRGTPQYDQNAPCVLGVDHVTQANTMYQILPGSADGTVPNVEVAGDLFTYCKNQMSEIMAGFAQTGEMTVTMTKDWCGWQASMTDWIGQSSELGHPDWDHRTCDSMALFVAYALRNDLQAGLTSHKVCQKLFLAKGAIKRVNKLIKDAWVASVRGPPIPGLASAVDDKAAAAALQAAQAYANAIFGKLREQKKAFDDINSAKMDTSAFAEAGPEAPVQAAPPGLPNSADFDTGCFIFLGSEQHLKSWGGNSGNNTGN